ncbi:MAG: ribulose-phosphate 3-epimerase [Candidatus Limnocylindrales bacterium]
MGTALERLLSGGPRLTAGMLTADLLHLGDELQILDTAGVELVHVDVMDGVFCPQLTVGPPVVKAMRTPLLKDVHLMVQDPLAKVDAFVAAGADLITFHLEGAAQPLRVLQALSGATNVNDPARGVVRGVGLNPSTPVEALEPLLEALDYILVLAINPGWSGQAFLPATAHRLERCRALIEASGRPILLGVDGGVTRDNAAYAAGLGVDIVVSGSAIFDGSPAAPNARLMRETIAAGGRSAALA